MADDTSSPPDEVLTTRGQPVVRVRRRKKDAAGEVQTIDEVVKRHLPAPTAGIAEGVGNPEDVYTPDAAVPPDEPDARKRDKPTIEGIELTPEAFEEDAELPPEVARQAEIPDLSDGRYRTLEDLNALFPFDGSGQYYVAVTRHVPKIHAGVACYGRQQNITRRLSHSDFCDTYGGGVYELIVYGPPNRGRINDPVTGLPVPKALTKPIRLTIPYMGAGAREPNPHSAFDEEESQDRGISGSGLHRGAFEKEINVPDALLSRRGNTPAEANMYNSHLEHQRIMDERTREDRKEREERRASEEQTLVGVVAQTKDQQIQMLLGQIEELKREQKNGKHQNGSDMLGLAKVLESVRGPQATQDELERVKSLYERQLADLRDTHQSRMSDLEARHQRDREDLTQRLQRDRDEVVRRAETEVERARQDRQALEQRLTHERDTERAAAQRELEREHANNVRAAEMLQKDHTRDIDNLKAQYESRINALKDRMESETRLLSQVHESNKAVEKTTVEAQLRTSEGEVRRLEAEVTRLRTELEKKSNLPKLVDEYAKTAEALGFVKDEGGPAGGEDADFKTLGMRALVGLMQNLPEVIKQAGQAAAAMRGGQAGPGQRMPLPPPGYGPPMALPPQRPPVMLGTPVQGWNTEDSGIPPAPLPAAYQQSPPALIPAVSAPPAPPPPAATGPLVAPPAMTPSQAPPAEYPATPSQVAPRPSQPPPAGPAQAIPLPSSPPPAARPAAPAPPAIEIPPEEIVKFAPDLEQLFQAVIGGTPVTDIAQAALAAQPGLRVVAPGLTAEKIVEALTAHGRSDSPLVRRDGQRFLRQFRAAILTASG